MANTITLKRRIGSIKNTRQITKAMELVAASKMRKAQEYASLGRSYRVAAHSLLTRLSAITEVNDHPLYVKRPIKTRLYIVVTSDQGLAGAYDANTSKLLVKSILDDQAKKINSQVITIGKKGAQLVRRLDGVNLTAVYPRFNDRLTANEIRPLLNSVVEAYRDRTVDDVQVLYTEFKSNIVQVSKALSLLPARFETGSEESSLSNTTFEPSINAVLDNVTERLLEVQLWQAILESFASEQSMRMMAMKNATDNANDLIGDLTLAFNTARQAAITQELAEITGGAEAMK
jgi:F-type H+-transporting ATPase subunit gamma